MEENVFSKRDCARRSTHLGPYKATKLWNDLIRTFRSGMPVGRHWRHMKSYEDCFSASEAVSWLHAHLQANPNFGPNVTRAQTVLLLEKFHKTRIFEDVRSTKHNRGEFSDGGRLFRFVCESPIKSKTSSSRIPLSTRTSLMNSASSPEVTKPVKMPAKEKTKSADKISRSKSFLKKKENIKLGGSGKKPTLKVYDDTDSPSEEVKREVARLTAMEVETTWKNMVLARLKTVLRVSTLDDILNSEGLNVRYLIHNMTQVNKNGIVTNIEKKDQLPQWVLSAMRCLAYWPVKVEDLPYYDGFEKDVFTVVKDYFVSQEEPLTTFDMYDVFTNVMATLEEQDQIEMPPPLLLPQSGSSLGPSPVSLHSCTSLENLMADLTMNAPTSAVDPADVMIVNDPDTIPDYSNMPDVVKTHSGIHYRHYNRCNSASSLPGAKLETSFGILGEEPETRLVVKQISPTYLSRSHNTMITPDNTSSTGSNSRLGIARDRYSSEHLYIPGSRDGNRSRASIRSAGYIPKNNVNPYQFNPPYAPHYNRYLQKNQRTTSNSTLQSSIGGSEADTSSPEYSCGNTISTSSGSSGQRSRFGSDEPPPRTCPEEGTYNQVSKSCVNLLNNVVANSMTGLNNPAKYNTPTVLSQVPAYNAQPRYHEYTNNVQLRSQSQASGSVSSMLHRSSANTSASSYDTACSHLSNNRDSVSLSNTSNNNRSSVGSIGMLNSRGESVSSSVFGSNEIKRPSPPTDIYTSRQSPLTDVFYKPSPLIEDYNQLNRQGSLRDSSLSSAEAHRPFPGFKPQMKTPVLNLQESYRIAVEGDRALGTTPMGKSLFGKPSFMKKSESSPNLRNFMSLKPKKNRTLEAIQICTLMLPPANRRKLHLLLRLMHKMVSNNELRMNPEKSTRQVVLETFSRCILRSPEEVDFNEMLSVQIVGFMMDNYTELMKVPADLKDRIEDKIINLRKTKSQSLASGTLTSEEVASRLSYCQQLSMQAYETQKLSSSQIALVDLLEDIVKNRKMSGKDKKKRLKQFQKHYPDIYSRRFPSSQSESDLFPEKPRIKPPLLARPLHKLKNLRL